MLTQLLFFNLLEYINSSNLITGKQKFDEWQLKLKTSKSFILTNLQGGNSSPALVTTLRVYELSWFSFQHLHLRFRDAFAFKKNQSNLANTAPFSKE